jgi:hypothetical protein
MDTFQKRTALRIALVSVVLASLASPIAWWVAREAAEESVVALANEESGRLLHRFDSINLSGPNAQQHAREAAFAIAGGLFDIAEIYDTQGRKLAESITTEGEAVETQLPKHGAPNYTVASYESIKPSPHLWLLRVFIPLRTSASDAQAPITVHGRPLNAKLSIHGDSKVKIAPVHSDFLCDFWSLSLMGFAG